MEKADGPVDSHKCQRKNWVVDQGEPKFVQILIWPFCSYAHTIPLTSVKALLLLLSHIVSSEASFETCKKVEEQKHLS